MKAIINNSKLQGKKFLLSIGMIVKNEEKYLDMSLSALKPLLDTGKVELVIVDTGSTDTTVEIAKKYTDKVYSFKWINDFSAARNFGLEKCTGEWFMFIDADEVFDSSVMEILKFLESSKADKFNGAGIHIRNYSDDSLTNYSEFIPSRMIRLVDGIKFSGSIHEVLPKYAPETEIQAYAYHYGYVGTEKQKQKKARNLIPLLEDYKKDPKNPKTLMYLHSTLEDYDEKEKYFKAWVEVTENDAPNNYESINNKILCYTAGATFYLSNNKYPETITYATKALEIEEIQVKLASMSNYAMIADSYYLMMDFNNAIPYLKAYIDKYKEYKDGKLNGLECDVAYGIQDYEFQKHKAMLAKSFMETGACDEAFKLAQAAELKKFQGLDESLISTSIEIYADTIAKFIEAKGDDKAVLKTFKAIAADLQDYFVDTALAFATIFYWNCKDKQIATGIISKVPGNSYYKIMFEILASKGTPAYAMTLQSFIDNLPEFSKYYSPAISEAIKAGCNLEKITALATSDDLNATALILHNFVEDYQDIVTEFCNSYEINTVKELYFEISLLKPLKTDEDLGYLYACLMANYVTNVYSADVLNDEDVTILPLDARLGYYMYKADSSMAVKDKLDYVRYLRRALKVDPDMKEAVRKLTEKLDIK